MVRKIIPALLFATFLVSLLISPHVMAAEKDVVVQYPLILKTVGLVSVRLPGEQWIPASEDMYVPNNATIRTSQDSQCDVALDDSHENILSLGAETTVTIGELSENIEVAKGRVFSLLDNLPEETVFSVKTPVAIAGVRGTRWETEVDDTAQFLVDDGAVDVTGIDQTGAQTGQSTVPGGKAVAASATGQLGDVRDLTEEEKERLRRWVDDLKDYLGSKSCSVLTNCHFIDLLVRILAIDMPAGYEELARNEQFEVEANLLAERGFPEFIGTECGDIVQRGFAAEVLSKALGVADIFETIEDKIAYLADLGYLSQGGAQEVLTSCTQAIAETYTPPTVPLLPPPPPEIPEKPATQVR